MYMVEHCGSEYEEHNQVHYDPDPTHGKELQKLDAKTLHNHFKYNPV